MMEGMQVKETGARQAERSRGLELVRGWTLAASLGALGLTGVLAVVAADSFHGRTISQNSTSAGSSVQSTQGDLTPQAPSEGAFGGGSQPPAVVSGGS
jgi:hypothetical protein